MSTVAPNAADPAAPDAPRFCRLSPYQEGMWALEQLSPANPAYVVSFGIHLDGVLDRGCLEGAIQSIWARHESLRSRFVTIDGVAHQKLGPRSPLKIGFEDLSAEPSETHEEAIRACASRAASTPFDLENGKAFRARLLRLDETRHLLLLTAHHLVTDGWSNVVILRELAAFYDAGVSGRRHQVPPLALEFGDYAAREHARLAGPEGDALMDYWVNQLVDAPDALQLPVDRPRPSAPSFSGARLQTVVPADLTAALRDVARAERATLFMATLAAFKVLLARWSTSEDIVVGTPISLRTEDTTPMVGMFVNTLALRTSIGPDTTFEEVIRRVKNTALDAYEHWTLPFESLVSRIDPKRDASRNPVFQVIFNSQPRNRSRWSIPGLDLRMEPFHPDGAQVDLALSMHESEEDILLDWSYSTALFDRKTIERMARSFDVLLAGLLADPAEPASAVEVLGAAEKERVLEQWNATATDYPDACLHELVARQAAQRPDAEAVSCGAETLTYHQLSHRVVELTARLQKLGIGPGDRVGIFMDRSIDMLAALLATLQSGAAYVPLDPGFPPERIAFMIDDSQVALVLSQSHLRQQVPGEARTVAVDSPEADPAPAAAASDNPAEGHADDLAYVIYTSGSTGTPNGVEITHGALVNFLESMRHAPGLTPDDVLLAVTTISFDIATLELFGPLVSGARTVIADHATTMDGDGLAAEIERCGVTVLQATPATWQLLLEAGWKGASGLKALCGGEPLPPRLADQLLGRVDSLWNMYGPTETTVWSTVAHVESADEITIGRPIANTRVHVLDANLRPVPVGVVGQLCIGGDGLARGYHKRPELTAAKFVPDPRIDGERLYLTGDLARYRNDGTLECLGRVDNQIKIRGFRIEPGDIEVALGAHPQVAESIVVVVSDPSGGSVLAAYFRSEPGEAPTATALRDHLRKRLPAYMVPSHLVRLEEVPRLPNGKINRRALPAPTIESSSPAGFAPPDNPLEQELAGLWEKVLGRRGISVNEDFFELGGHSLLAARLFALINERLDAQLPLATLFEAPTVRELARVVQGDAPPPSWGALVPIRASGSRPPLFCVHGAEGNVLIYRELAGHLDPDQPVFGLQARGLDGHESPPETIEELARHHVEAIRKASPQGPYHLCGYCLGGTIAYEMAQQLTAAGHEVGVVAMLETYNVKSIPSEAATRLNRWRNKVENVAFHLRNLLLLRGGQMVGFLRRKGAVEKTRLLLWLQSFGSRELPHRRVTRTNDLAQLRYSPRRYGGRVVLFRPRGLFSGLEDADFGWRDLTDVETRVLPVYPRGMLVEPFVAELARSLDECLADGDDAEADPGRTSTSGGS